MSEFLGIVGILLSLLSAGAFMLWFCDGGKFNKEFRWWNMDDGSEGDDK